MLLSLEKKTNNQIIIKSYNILNTLVQIKFDRCYNIFLKLLT